MGRHAPRKTGTARRVGTVLGRRKTALAATAGAVVLAAVVAVVASTATACPARAKVEITYSVRQDGAPDADLDSFAESVASTLHDPRGWSLGGEIRFERVSSNADMRVVLAAPEVVEAAADACSARWSCRAGERVLINVRRWRHDSAAWQKSREAYRHYVVNHEVGHFLGMDHRHCPEAGQPAPVMQQQSKDREGCRNNVWPKMSELRAVAREQGVSAPEHSPDAPRTATESPSSSAATRDSKGSSVSGSPSTSDAPSTPDSAAAPRSAAPRADGGCGVSGLFHSFVRFMSRPF